MLAVDSSRASYDHLCISFTCLLGLLVDSDILNLRPNMSSPLTSAGFPHGSADPSTLSSPIPGSANNIFWHSCSSCSLAPSVPFPGVLEQEIQEAILIISVSHQVHDSTGLVQHLRHHINVQKFKYSQKYKITSISSYPKARISLHLHNLDTQ